MVEDSTRAGRLLQVLSDRPRRNLSIVSVLATAGILSASLAALVWGIAAILAMQSSLCLSTSVSPSLLRSPPRPPPAPVVLALDDPSCAVPRQAGRCRLKENERIHIVFVSAMWYREPFTKHETNAILKSVIAQTRCKLWIHFLVAGPPETTVIPAMMEKIGAWQMIPNLPVFMRTEPPPPRYLAYVNRTTPHEVAILYSLHMIPTKWVEEQTKLIRLYPLTHHAGVPGMSKFFMADILWQVKRAVFLDVDMVFGGDIQDMWDYFEVMQNEKRLLYYMSSDNPEGRGTKGRMRPYCSCQMILDFMKIRKKNLTNLLVTALDGRSPRELEEFVDDGDQWLFTWVCKQFPGICNILPRLWNLSGCSKPSPFLGLNGRSREVNGSCWRIVHFNCLGHHQGLGGSYEIPEGWAQTVRWARLLKPDKLRQRQDTRVWKAEVLE